LFIERRLRNLQTFIDRVVRHPKLYKSKRLAAFLSPDVLVKTQALGQQASLIDNVSETLLHTFAKSSPRKQDERSEPHRIQVGQLEDSIARAERSQIRLARADRSLSASLTELSTCTIDLSKMETGMGQPLANFSQRLSQAAAKLSVKGKEEEIGTVAALHMYVGYCEAVKDLLKLRDQKQVEAEALSDYLSKAMVDRDRYSIPGKIGGGIAGWVKGQYDERVRGVDPERSRLESLAKLERKVASLQVAVQEGAQMSNVFGDAVAEEVEGWSVTRQADVRSMLHAHAQVQVDFHSANLEIWDSLIAELEKSDEPLP
jgi:sorting nexin-4